MPPPVVAVSPETRTPHSTTPQNGMIAALLGLVLIASIALPNLQARPGIPVTAIFPPWWTHEAAFAAAARSGVSILGAGITPNTLIVSSDNVSALGRLYGNGVWSVLNIDVLAGCFGSGAEPRS